jgi:hypothetical protein
MRSALFAAVILGFYASGSAEPLAGDCSAACDKEAAACVDACEEKFPNDPSARIGCKLKCAEKRTECDKGCP